MTDHSMRELFQAEVVQQTAVLSDSLLALESQPTAVEPLASAMRAAHSIKGAARLVDVPSIVELAHVMEDVFVAAQETRHPLSSNDIDLLLQGMDMMSQMATYADEAPNDWLMTAQNGASHKALLAQLQQLLADEKPVDGGEESSNELENFSMLELFRTELEQQGNVLSEGLLALEQMPEQSACFEALMRAAHSIKGAARLVGVQAVVDLAHVMEDVFVAAQSATLVFTAESVDVMLEAVDFIQAVSACGDDVNDCLTHQQAQHAALMVKLYAVLNGEKLPEAPPEDAPIESVNEQVNSPSIDESNVTLPAKERVLRVSAEQINRLMGLAGESMVESRWLYPFAGSLLRLKRQQTELVCILDRLREQLDSEELSDSAQTLVRGAQKQASHCREMLNDRLADLETHDRRACNLSSRLHREVVSSRMRPFGDGIQGFPRMVRDVSRKLNKDVQLLVDGEATMVDRDILDKMEAPLNHIIRNAIDHGLESSEARVAAGKTAKGTIRLSAYHHAGMLSLVVEDDGRGVDLDVLREKVIAKGLLGEDLVAELSDTELLDFMFLPSFSTRDSVSEISGRGVGLDVVHDVMQEMCGSVRVHSTLGKKTRFHMQLPLTLSVIPSLLVEISGEPYAFPLARIDRILCVEQLRLREAEGNQFISIDGENVGLVNAAQIMGMAEAPDHSRSLSVVVLSERQNYYGMVVDRFIGERELVVQLLPNQLGKVQDISAAALMEDGSPLLIVDVDDLLRSIEKVLKVTRVGRVASVEDGGRRSKHILVVDDSITVREVERKLLEAAGYLVDVAVDGIDGLNAMRSGQFDLLITDVDMPRMNGIELTRTIRQDPQLHATPVMMVSYKDRQEDRMKGLMAGADYYLTKGSFEDEGLRHAVIELIGEARL